MTNTQKAVVSLCVGVGLYAVGKAMVTDAGADLHLSAAEVVVVLAVAAVALPVLMHKI